MSHVFLLAWWTSIKPVKALGGWYFLSNDAIRSDELTAGITLNLFSRFYLFSNDINEFFILQRYNGRLVWCKYMLNEIHQFSVQIFVRIQVYHNVTHNWPTYAGDWCVLSMKLSWRSNVQTVVSLWYEFGCLLVTYFSQIVIKLHLRKSDFISGSHYFDVLYHNCYSTVDTIISISEML